jgi:hypothetical protein
MLTNGKNGHFLYELWTKLDKLMNSVGFSWSIYQHHSPHKTSSKNVVWSQPNFWSLHLVFHSLW